MILSCRTIGERLGEGLAGDDPLVITPLPDLGSLAQSGGDSVDLRLGTWFEAPRPGTTPFLDISPSDGEADLLGRFAKTIYMPFGQRFMLHPRNFVLAGTLEWIRLPGDLAASVVGKSSWGRRGLVIATATSVHPGFSGCLTLELSNLGEVPIAIYPGMLICQLLLSEVESSSAESRSGQFDCYRRPVLGDLHLDEIAERLKESD